MAGTNEVDLSILQFGDGQVCFNTAPFIAERGVLSKRKMRHMPLYLKTPPLREARGGGGKKEEGGESPHGYHHSSKRLGLNVRGARIPVRQENGPQQLWRQHGPGASRTAQQQWRQRP